MSKIQWMILSFILGGVLLWGDPTVWATTYYVRMDGGTPTQCTGTANVPYSGTGTNQACALNHPVWALGAAGTQGLMAGGDTLIIDDTNHATGGQAQYKIGYGMPNTVSANCYPNWSYSCVMSNVPSGPSPTNPTRILGINYSNGCNTKPQLWGSDGAYQIFNLSGSSNVDLECMELTDHSNCGYEVGNPQCPMNWNEGQLSGPWGRNGIYAQGGSNFSFVNLDVHGFANRGFLMGGIDNITFSYVNMDGNYMSNWDGDVGETGNVSYNSGAIVLDHVKNRFAGCSEAFPRSSTFNTADYSNCTDQNATPPGYGDGLGMFTTGGNWVVTDSEFSHNTQDGFDLLYHDATGSVTIQRSLFEGSDGNQIKVTSPNTDIENSVVIGNCHYLSVTDKVYNISSFVACRAGGDAIVLSVTHGGNYKLYNSSIYAGGNSAVLIVNNLNTCNGSENYSFLNNIYKGNGLASLYIDQRSGSCATPPLHTNYTINYNFANSPCPSGSNNKCSTPPLWVAAISPTADTNLPSVYLQSSSPAVGIGEIISGISVLDYNGVSRNPYWDMGAIQNISLTTAPTGTTTTGTGTTTGSSTTGTLTIGTGVTFVPSSSTQLTSPTVTTVPSSSSTDANTTSNSSTSSNNSTSSTSASNGWGTVITPPSTVTVSNGTVTFKSSNGQQSQQSQ